MFSNRTNWNLNTNRLSEALARHRAAGSTILDLTASNPTECGFQYDGRAIMRALCSQAALEYHPDAKGIKSAREAIRGYYREKGIAISAEDMVLTTSTSEAYSFVFRLLCNPGDEVLIPAPSYPLFDFLAEIQDVTLKPYPLIYDHGWQMDLHAMEQAISERTRAMIVVNPNNPTGHFVKAAELTAINKVCVTRNIGVIADEVFLDFQLVPQSSTSFAANQDALTFTMSGLSKISGLPQMKLAWLIASGLEQQKREALARLEVIADTFLSVSTPIQVAARELLGQRQEFQRQVMARIKSNLAELNRQLAAQRACSRLEVEGGWYVVLRVPATRSDEELALELLEKKDVYVHPGHFFDFQQEGYLVVSLITPQPTFREGIKRLFASF